MSSWVIRREGVRRRIRTEMIVGTVHGGKLKFILYSLASGGVLEWFSGWKWNMTAKQRRNWFHLPAKKLVSSSISFNIFG